MSPETTVLLPAAWMESTLPFYQRLYWLGAPGTPVDSSRACLPPQSPLRTEQLALRWAS